MATCDTLTLKTFRVSQLSTYDALDSTDFLLIIESGSALYSRKTTLGNFSEYLLNSGLTGSYTGSFTGSATLNGTFHGDFSGSLYGTASNAVSSSYSLSSSYSVSASAAISASYSISSSHSQVSISSSYSAIADDSVSSSYSIIADDSISSSYSLTSSHSEQADNSISASYSLSSSYIIPSPSLTRVTTTVYFDRQTLSDVGGLASVNATSVNDSSLPPTPLSTDWTAFNIKSKALAAGAHLPISYPKVAILNVYHSSSIAQISGYANTYAFFTSHKTSNWTSDRANYVMQGAWGGEDARAAVGYYVYGDVYYARMSGNSEYLYVQYSELFNPGGATARTNLNIDLIGIQY